MIGWGMGRVIGWYAGSSIFVNQVIDLGDGAHMFGAGLAYSVDMIITGLSLILLQAAILRHWFDKTGWWVIASLLAWMLVGVPGRLLPYGLDGLLTGAALGTAQWFVL
jgi:hypothetical protein